MTYFAYYKHGTNSTILANLEFVPDTFSGFRKLDGIQYFWFRENAHAENYLHAQSQNLLPRKCTNEYDGKRIQVNLLSVNVHCSLLLRIFPHTGNSPCFATSATIFCI